MIGSLTLWQVVVMWWLQRRNKQMVTFFNYPMWLRQVSDQMLALPIPRTELERWLTARVMMALEIERDRIMVLRAAGVVACGVIREE